jgi:E3 ubiquitin-protein ligase listerin
MQDNPSLVKLLSVLVEIFGPTPLLLKNYQKNDENSDMKPYPGMFNDDFLPWCLNGKYSTCNSKIDLLLALFQDDCFFEQWCSVIKYISAKQKSSVDDNSTNIMDQFEIFTLLLQKIRERIAGGKLINLHKNGYLPEHWQHDLLNYTAVSVFCDSSPADSHANFLRYMCL